LKKPGRPRKGAAGTPPATEPEQGKDGVKSKTRGRPRKGTADMAGLDTGGPACGAVETQEEGMVGPKSKSRGRQRVEVAEVKSAVGKLVGEQAEGEIRRKSRSSGRPRKEVAEVPPGAQQDSEGGQGGQEVRPKRRGRAVKGADVEPEAAPTRSRSRGGAQKKAIRAPVKVKKGRPKTDRSASSELPETEQAAEKATNRDGCPGSTDGGGVGVAALGGILSGAAACADETAAKTGTVWPHQLREDRRVPSSVEAFFGRKTTDSKRQRTSRMSVNQASFPLALASLSDGGAQIGAVEVVPRGRADGGPSGEAERGLAIDTSSAVVAAPKPVRDVVAVTPADKELGAARGLNPLVKAGAGSDRRTRSAAKSAGKRKDVVEFANPPETAASDAPGNISPRFLILTS